MKRSVLAFILLLFLFSTLAHAATSLRDMGPAECIPQPRLVYPYTQEVDLTGKECLEFKWNTAILADYFDFKIYKGYNETAANLIFKQRIPSGTSVFSIKSDLFQDGQVYTWSLRTIKVGMGKSDRSYVSFKVIKKP